MELNFEIPYNNLAHLQCESVGVGFIRPETTGVINVAPTIGNSYAFKLAHLQCESVGVGFIRPAGLINQAPTILNREDRNL